MVEGNCVLCRFKNDLYDTGKKNSLFKKKRKLFFFAGAKCLKEIINTQELIQAVKFLTEAQVQQQRTQQCFQEELIVIRKEQFEILKTNKGNSN